MTDKFVAARKKHDAEYPAYMAMQALVQSAGRAVRSVDDWAECVAPETPVLTADLRWVPAGDLCVGDRLIGFDEHGGSRERRRGSRIATVEAAVTRTMNRVLVRLTTGDLICAPHHQWLKFNENASRMSDWKRADQLKPGDKLTRYFRPWSDVPGYREGWLGGMLDGEGCLVVGAGKRNPRVNSVYISQNEGVVLDQVLKSLTEMGFTYSVSQRTRCHVVRIGGGLPEHLRLLGSCRPLRLLERLAESGALSDRMFRSVDHVEVLGVSKIHRGPITSIQTDTKTYIADGFGSHNCFILDAQAVWFLRKYRHLAPQWFLDAVRYPTAIPAPPGR